MSETTEITTAVATQPEPEKHLNGLLNALKDIIGTNQRAVKDNASLSRSLAVLEDRFTKVEHTLVTSAADVSKWHQLTDNQLNSQGNEIDSIYKHTLELSERLIKMGGTIEAHLSTLHSMLVEMSGWMKSVAESRRKK